MRLTKEEAIQISIGWELIQWARWMYCNAVKFGARSPMAALIRIISGTVLPTPLIEDERADQITAAVKRLEERDKQKADVIKWYYLQNRSDRRIARTLRCSSNKARLIRLSAESWIDGAVNGIDLDCSDC